MNHCRQPSTLLMDFSTSDNRPYQGATTEDNRSDDEQELAPRDKIIRWMQQTFRYTTDEGLPKQTVFEQYIEHCEKNGWIPASAASCGRMVHTAFPKVECTRRGGRGRSIYYYGNIAFIDESKQPAARRRRYTSRSWLGAKDESPKYKSIPFKKNKADDKNTKRKKKTINKKPSYESSASESEQSSCPSSPVSDSPTFTTLRSSSPSGSYCDSSSPSSVSSSPVMSPTFMHEALSFMDTIQNEDALKTIFDGYYQDLFFCLLQGSEVLAREVITRFWIEELSYELNRLNVDDILQYEQSGLTQLLQKLLDNPTQLSNQHLANYMTLLAGELPRWISQEAKKILPPHIQVVHRRFWDNAAEAMKEIASTLRKAEDIY